MGQVYFLHGVRDADPEDAESTVFDYEAGDRHRSTVLQWFGLGLSGFGWLLARALRGVSPRAW